MPPQTRSQTARETIALSPLPPPTALAASSHPPTEPTPSFLTNDPTWKPSRKTTSPPGPPPRFTIDLSQPPEKRYLAVCTAFRAEMQELTSLFDEVTGNLAALLSRRGLVALCRLLLRGVRDAEETRELRGIARATGVPMYLLVCFNVLLDLFMGCSSGGAVVRDQEGGEEEEGGRASKMVHFRTLDWGMPALRKVIVQLDFVVTPGGPVVASSITYAGYVGVLTGVREGFSVSLNFRPNRNDKGKFWADAKYYWHLGMVLLGRRQSISSEIRRTLLPRRNRWGRRPIKGLKFYSYSNVVQTFVSGLSTTACYLCFSDGHETTVLEKDRVTAVVHRSNDFLVVTNNDVSASPNVDVPSAEEASADQADGESHYAAALADIIFEAQDRKQCAEHNYHNQRAAKAKRDGVRPEDPAALQRVLDVDDIVRLVQKYPTTNESTHFACVLDPKAGRVHWCRRWINPVTSRWIREHMSDTW